MKWLLLSAVFALGVGALFWAMRTNPDRQDGGPLGDEWASPRGTEPADLRDDVMHGDGILPVGVYGVSGGTPVASADDWREKSLRWPADATRLTGKVLLEAIDGQVGVRFPDAKSKRAFESTEFLAFVPREETMELELLSRIVEPFGFFIEDRGTWIMIAKAGP